jgi:site-specific DNA-methyltransferase (adenine-specific)
VRRLVRLHQADARAFLASLPDESVDLAITDPPYVFDRGDSRFRNWFEASIADSEWPAVFAQLYRVLAQDAHAYVLADRRVQALFASAASESGFRVRNPLVWDKCSVGLGGLWRSQYELIGVYEKGTRPGNYRNRGDVLRVPRVARGYPTEKPVRLLRQLISQSSVRGELVLDPFCGSGSTGIAARELGRRGLLCDVDAGSAAARLRLAIELREGPAA